MTNLLSLSSNILSKVVDEDISFSIAIRNFAKDKKITNVERRSIASLVSCSLKHFYVFERKINELFPNITKKVKYDLFVFLANGLFINVSNEEIAKEFITSTFLNEVEEENKVNFESFLEKSKTKDFLTITDLKENSHEFLSIRYNTPLWLVKMWGKHFKESLLYKTLRANTKSSKQFLLVNSSKNDKNEFLACYPEFEECEFNDMVLYSQKESLKNTEAYKENLIATFSPALSYAIDTCDIDPFRNIAVFTGYRTNVYMKLIYKFSTFAKFDLITNDSSCYFDAKKTKQELGLDKMRIYEQDSTSIISCVSEPVHTFIVMPRNSNFASFKTVPDYFLRFKQEDLDSILDEERTALHEASLLVEDNGELLYAVPTLNVKEGRDMIKKFISNHNNFVLCEEKQFFPFGSSDTTFYFARLRKTLNMEKDSND